MSVTNPHSNMFSNQNKLVTTKFQSARKTVATKPIQTKVTNASTMLRSCALSSITNCSQTGPRNLVKPQASNSVQPPKPPTKSHLAGGAQKLTVRFLDNTSSRMRAKAATVPRNLQTFTTSRRIYRPSASKIFDYDLSREEKHNFSHCPNPMKSVPAAELQLLQSGQRATYLETRYERTPNAKYYYPEATSWRYGWFHQKHATR